MTNQQEMKVNMIKSQAENLHSSNNYEIKRWEVEETEYFISLVVEVGMKGDEGTMASILCRDTLHVFIGKKGGVRKPMYNRKTKKSYYKPFKHMSFGDNNTVNA